MSSDAERASLLGDENSLKAEFERRKEDKDKLQAAGFLSGSAGDRFADLAKSIKDMFGKDSKQSKLMEFDAAVRRKDLIMLVVALIGLLLYIIHMAANFNYEKRYVETTTGGSYFMQFLMAINTAILVCLLFDSYQLDVWLYRKFENAPMEHIEGRFWPRDFISQFMVEASLLFIHPIPGIFPNKMGVFMLLRVYLFARVVRDNSELYLKRGIIYKSGYKDRGGPDINTFLCIKTAIDKNPGFAVALCLGWVVLAFSYVTYIIQREGNDAEGISFFQCIWATVFLLFRGVARFEAHDAAGRLIELLIVIIGVLCLAFIISLVTISMDVKPAEIFALQWLRKHEKFEQRQVMGAELIQAAWRFSQLQKKNPEDLTMEVQIYFEELIAKHKKFRMDCEVAANLSLDPAHDKLLESDRRLDTTADELEQIKADQEKLMEMFDELN